MIKLSASSMGTFDKCPKQYHYRYIEKPNIPKKDWSFLEFGKCAHLVLEYFHEDLITNVREVSEYPSVMRDSFRSALKEFDMNILRDELPLLKRILQSYLDKMKKEGLPNVLYNELQFDMMIGDYKLRGFIDRVDRVGPGEYEIVDYKTNKNPKYLTKFQLLLYALVIKAKFPDAKKISGSYVLLKHDCKSMRWEFTDKEIEGVRNKVLSVGNSIETRDVWDKKPTVLCNWCDYQNLCEDSWAEGEDTGDDDWT